MNKWNSILQSMELPGNKINLQETCKSIVSNKRLRSPIIAIKLQNNNSFKF